MSESSFTQRDRPLRLTTSLGEDVLLARSVQGSEHLGQLYDYRVDVASENPDWSIDALLGSGVCIEIVGPSYTRLIHGLVVAIDRLGFFSGFHQSRLSICPWPWMLRLRSDIRVFQNQSVVDVATQLFDEAGFGDYRNCLSETHEPREYCVQYRETSWAFVSRLFREEGIFFRFQHELDKHVLELHDSTDTLESEPGYDTVEYRPEESSGQRSQEYVLTWDVSAALVPGRATVRSYDYEKPASRIEGQLADPRATAHGDYERYDFSLQHASMGLSESEAQRRLLGVQQVDRHYAGRSDAIGLRTGRSFTLANHPANNHNQPYLITGTELSAVCDLTSDGSAELDLEIGLAAQLAQRTFHPSSGSPKPRALGTETAVVTGPDGQEIHTDELGRITVQFHWDREGKRNESSSCWIRVAQSLAGQGWGQLHVPRVGQEVVVSFLDGDPDKPIVVGSVYNGLHAPPYSLPENKTQSGLVTRSSMSGGKRNFNELRFEDRIGEEQIAFQAEKDLVGLVKNDSETHVMNDARSTVDGNVDASVGEHQTLSVGKTLSIDAGQKITLKTGQSSIEMSSNGDIVIKGVKILTQGVEIADKADASVTVDAGATYKLKAGAAVTAEGAMVSIKASGVLTLQGSLTKVN